MEKKINPVLKRLSEFADSQGGFAEIGRRIQKHPSMFYNLIRRDALPSVSTLTEIAMEFPDLDLNYIIRGENKSEDAASAELERVKGELQRREAIITGLLGKSKGANISPDFVIKKHRGMSGKAATQYARHPEKRKNVSKPLSVRVQGVKIPSLLDLLQ